MTAITLEFAGTDHRFGQNILRTSSTRQATTTAIARNMDQKEIEDRMAAAEALSSLGLPADFRASEPPVQSPATVTQPPVAKTEKSTRGRGRGRGKDKGDNRDTGRETKSRSTRGRGKTKDTQQSATRNTPALPPTAQGENFLLLQRQLERPVNDAAPQPKRRNAGGKRGKQAAQIGVTMTNHSGASATVTSETGVAVQGDARIVHNLQVPGSFAVHSGGSTAQQTTLIPSVPGRTRNGKIPASPSSAAASSPFVQTGSSPGVSIPLSLATSMSAAAAAGRVPSTPTDSLPSQPFLKSLGSLPSFSLGSTGLPSTGLPSVPNLPSLPSAIAALELSGADIPDVASLSREDAAGLDSQLSPHGRESDEKSLPLKKRKIFDSSAVSSSASSRLNSVSSVSPTSTATAPSTSAPVPSPTPMQQDRPTEAVLSPGPAKVHLLTQVLPPAVSMQLLSEITTAVTPDEDGDLPLHIAVVHENEAMVKKLIQLMDLAGRSVDRYNKQQQTPLHLAIKLSYLPAIQMLLEAGANPNLVDSLGMTSIHMAVQDRDLDCLEALLQWSKVPCNLNDRNFEGLAPLHSAVINNDLEIVRTLLDHEADINIMDGKSGRTVLFHAAEGNQRNAVELLLRRGADPEIANYAGVIPAMAAQGRSHTFVSRLLTRAVDEGLDDMALGSGGPEEMEVVVSDESSDSVRTSVSDKSRNSVAGIQSRPALVRSLSRSQPQSPSKPPSSTLARRNSQGPIITVSAGSGASGTGKIIVTNSSTTTTSQPLAYSAAQPVVNAKRETIQEVPRVLSELGGSPQALATAGLQQRVAMAHVMHSLMRRALTEQRKDDSQGGTSRASPTSSDVPSPVTLPVSVPATSLAVHTSASNAARLVSLPVGTIARVSPAASVPSSNSGRMETDSSVSPSPAHAQPTRPLLLFRSTSVDPASGDGRRMGSVELRHVTADALLALQQSATNSVNPANQLLRPVDSSLRSDPANFEQLRSFLASSQPSVPRPNNIPVQIPTTPPVANHVSSDSLQRLKNFYDLNDSTDQPKDLSLKSRKPNNTTVKSEPEPLPKQLASQRQTVTHPCLQATLGRGPLTAADKVPAMPAFLHMNNIGPASEKPTDAPPPKPKAKRTRNPKPKAAKEKTAGRNKDTAAANFEKIGGESSSASAAKSRTVVASEEVIMPAVLESTKLALQVKINSNESKPPATVLTAANVETKVAPAIATASATQGKEYSTDKGQTTGTVMWTGEAKVAADQKIPVFSDTPQSFERNNAPVVGKVSPTPQKAAESSVKVIKFPDKTVKEADHVHSTSEATDNEPSMPVLEAEGCMLPPPDRMKLEKDAREDCPDLSDDVDMGQPPTPDSPALVIDTGEGSPPPDEQPMETG